MAVSISKPTEFFEEVSDSGYFRKIFKKEFKANEEDDDDGDGDFEISEEFLGLKRKKAETNSGG